MEIYKILVIGNSFGEDATHFLHDLALTRGINTKVVNLYIVCIIKIRNMAFCELVGTDKKPRYLSRWKGDLWRFIKFL